MKKTRKQLAKAYKKVLKRKATAKKHLKRFKRYVTSRS